MGWIWTPKGAKAQNADLSRSLEPTQLTRVERKHERPVRHAKALDSAVQNAKFLADRPDVHLSSASVDDMPPPEDDAPISVSILMRALPERF